MIYLLVHKLLLSGWLESHHLRFLRVFIAPEFQAPAAVVIGFLICVLLGPWVIRWLRQQKIGDANQTDIHANNAAKHGTPTMGGVLIIAAIVVTDAAAGEPFEFLCFDGTGLHGLAWRGRRS